MTNDVDVKRDGHVLEIILNRGKVNAIDVPTSQALAAAFVVRNDPDLRVAILTGGGDRIFPQAGTLRRSMTEKCSSTTGGKLTITAKAALPA